MEKICPKCGNEYSKDIKFCERCGTILMDKKIEPLPQNQQPLVPSSQQEMQVIKPSKTVKFKKTRPIEKIVIPAIIIAIILSIVAIALPMILPEGNLASNSVGSNQIKNNSVTGEKILDGSITDNDISNDGLSKLATNSVTSQTILNGTIEISDLSDKTIQALSGLTLIKDYSISGSKIANQTINTLNIKDNAITSAKIADGTINSSDIAPGAVNTDKIADNAVTYDKLYIKIKFGTRQGAINGTTITHGFTSTPSQVIVTPVYVASVLNGSYAIYANVISISPTSFKIGLWYITLTSPPVIHAINATTFPNGVSVNWIAIL